MATINGTSANNLLTGTVANDTINGLGGNDTLGGSAGNDTLAGGTGNDIYVVNSSGDKTNEAANAGIDTVRASISWALATNVENLLLTGSANLSGSGNGGSNAITGNSGNNTLTGKGGNDTLNGGVGIDTAVYAGVATGYRVSLLDGKLQVVDIDASNGNEGTDTLNGIERIKFGSSTITIDYAYAESAVNSVVPTGQGQPGIAALANNGGYVVTWFTSSESYMSDIYAQRYDISGSKISDEFLVNTALSNSQYLSRVAGLSNGGFVVTWFSIGQDEEFGYGDGGIYARLYDANGTPAGDEFLVNTETESHQTDPRIAALNDGGFVVTWTTPGGISAQRYDADAAAVGGEFAVTTNASGDYQTQSSVTSLEGGGFVVTWLAVLNGTDFNAYARCYDANGNALGEGFLVGEDSGFYDTRPCTAGLADGGFVIAWVAYDKSGYGVYAQRYDAEGTPIGNEFRANPRTDGNQYEPSITALSDGGFVITWSQGWRSGIYAQCYDADGNPTSKEIYVGKFGYMPSVAAMGDGSFVISWAYEKPNVGQHAMLSQRFSPDGTVLGITGDSGDNILSFDDGPVRMTGKAGNDTYIVSNFNDKTIEDADAGTDTVRSSINWSLDENVENLQLMGLYDLAGTGNELNNLLRGNAGNNVLDGGAGTDTVAFSKNMLAYAISMVADGVMIVDGRDAGVPSSTGADTLVNIEKIQFEDGTYIFSDILPELRVNTEITHSQTRAASVLLTNGGYVITWATSSGDGAVSKISAQRYDSNGTAIGDEFMVTAESAGSQNSANIAALSDGGFIVTWHSDATESGNFDVHARRFDVNGDAIGDEFLVNSETINQENEPHIASFADGSFVAIWASSDTDGSMQNIYARIFAVDGEPVDVQFPVNITTSGIQNDPVIAALPSGDFVIAWAASEQSGVDDPSGIYIRHFSGGSGGAENLVNTETGGSYRDVNISTLMDGGFLVTWTAFGQDGDQDGIYARRYSSDGTAIGQEFPVNTHIISNQSRASSAALTDGGFVVVWDSEWQDGFDQGIYAQRYDAAGNTVGGEFRVNRTIEASQSAATIIGLSDGGFVISWQSTFPNSLGTDIFAQRYAADGTLLTITGDIGNNTLGYTDGPAKLIGGAGNDIYVVGGNEVLFESSNAGIDTVKSSVGWVLETHFENLTLTGGMDIDGLGNDANNVLSGNVGNNALFGLGGNDTLIGGGGADSLAGGQGNDTYIVDSIDDVVFELSGEGKDTVKAQSDWALASNLENLTLTGGGSSIGAGNELNNIIIGNAGQNILFGDSGNDTLSGGNGHDILSGGLGRDTLSGNSGKDFFYFDMLVRGNLNTDAITDFKVRDDSFLLDNAAFKKLTADGILNSSFFRGNTAGKAMDKNDYIVYETDTGKLFYDADGSGKGAAIQFATIVGHPDNVTYKDFMVV